MVNQGERRSESGLTVDDTTALRVQYQVPGLGESAIPATPLAAFDRWFEEAVAAGVPEPNAVSLATCGNDGPSVRTVLAKSVAAAGLTFFTNTQSAKARQMRENPAVAATFVWITQHRQILMRGVVESVSAEAASAYFASRPRAAQIGAWASHQSKILQDRNELLDSFAEISERFSDESEEIPLPPFWGGYLLRPSSVEFWQGQPSRLHDRLRFVALEESQAPRLDSEVGWRLERLSP